MGGKVAVNNWNQLSHRLAALARTVRDRIQTSLALEAGSGPLTQLLQACRTTLVHHLAGEGFADMYAQTITYGLLSARITDPTRPATTTLPAHLRTNPLLKALVADSLLLQKPGDFPGGGPAESSGSGGSDS